MRLFKVNKPGLFTTVQDLGRYGFQRYGVPVSGAMDNFAFTLANYLVGNRSNDACLEMTLLGSELEFLSDSWVAITGANLSPALNGEEVACWQTLAVHNEDVLSFGRSQCGCSAYLAVRGGINVPLVMNSRSTYVRGGFGGFRGRQLKMGDVVEGFETGRLKKGFCLPKEFVPFYPNELEVEVVFGPQSEYFTNEGREVFLSSDYVVTVESDRMGYRLDGSKVERKGSLDMVSDAIPVGSIQVPKSGKPIIIMRDAQTTGGYPKIGVVTTPDVSLLGQVKPNDKVKFSQTSPSRARAGLLEYMRDLQNVRNMLLTLELY
ncbi:biotin-dependent carboxyltransferase family protein [Candidatus Bathyarchaeota archaeon]|nr:biotin-dependent carboxyltransferase family protein [Candidatus Bathyarchaeota archaeon]